MKKDILSDVIRHLVQNGVSVYLIDNHSTDDTVERASEWLDKGVINIEHFPHARIDVGERFAREDLLKRKEELASELKADRSTSEARIGVCLEAIGGAFEFDLLSARLQSGTHTVSSSAFRIPDESNKRANHCLIYLGEEPGGEK